MNKRNKNEEDEIHLWGRDIEHDDFIEGHYGDDRHEPTPEGGQADRRASPRATPRRELA